MSILNVRNLTKKYSKSCTAVNNISFSLHRGQTLGILGENGAGKTTTIHMLLGLLTPTEGNISYFGKNFFKYRSTILEHVGFGTTYAKLPGRLTVYNNLDIYGRLYGLSKPERQKRIQELLERLQSWDLRDRYAGNLSSGEMTRIVLVKAFLPNPKIVLLDEPTASLDVSIAQEIRDFIREKRDSGTSFLITSHNMHEMTDLCDRIIVMKKGTIIDEGTPEHLSSKVSQSILQLLVGNDIKKAINYAQSSHIPYTTHKHSIALEINEHKVAQTLMHLAEHGITYTQITIKNPTLEDYFLSCSGETK